MDKYAAERLERLKREAERYGEAQQAGCDAKLSRAPDGPTERCTLPVGHAEDHWWEGDPWPGKAPEVRAAERLAVNDAARRLEQLISDVRAYRVMLRARANRPDGEDSVMWGDEALLGEFLKRATPAAQQADPEPYRQQPIGLGREIIR